MSLTMLEAKTNGGIESAQRCAETIEQWHRLIDWARGTDPEPRELSREDRRFLMQETDWPNDPDTSRLAESLETQACEWPLSVEYRCGSWQLDPTSCAPDEFRITICTGGPAVAVFGDIRCSGYPIDCELKGQDWFTPWESVDCDSDALQWFAELFIYDA